MYDFYQYSMVVYQTQADYFRKYPDRRFVAYLKEIPEESLHAYGDSPSTAIENLKEQFNDLMEEASSTGFTVPPPGDNESREYSGKTVVRMPAWLHAWLAKTAEEEGVSLNNAIVSRLIFRMSADVMKQLLVENIESFLKDISHEFSEEPKLHAVRSSILNMGKKLRSKGKTTMIIDND